jgi:U4/U6.U5 tri-snRNP-associated protein 3
MSYDDVEEGYIDDNDADNNSSRKRQRVSDNEPTKKKNHTQKSREELELERQRRMAAIRAENGYKEDTIHSKTFLSSSSVSDHHQHEQQSKRRRMNGKETILHVNFDEIRNSKHKADHHQDNEYDNNSNDDDDENDDDDDEQLMMKELFGITNFGTTKYTKVDTNHTTAAIGVISKKKSKGRKYRQYMNRKNGFNRPLDNV